MKQIELAGQRPVILSSGPGPPASRGGQGVVEARQTGAHFWFWRTYDRKEMDLVVESDRAIRGYEIKWNPRKARIPKVWRETYGPGEIITRENLLQIVQPVQPGA